MFSPDRAISPRDKFIIFNTLTMTNVESHFTQERADHACDVLNTHEIKNKRTPCYIIKEYNV